MTNLLMSFAAALVPRTAGGRVTESRICIHPDSFDRLIVRNVIDSLYWRLVLRNARIPTGADETAPVTGGTQDFHSLVWERLRGTQWHTHLSLKARHFRKGRDTWVHDVHSIDPATGVAIIQVVENEIADSAELPPDVLAEAKKGFPTLEGLRYCRAQYSWVSWSLLTNERLATLQRCKSPFEQYDG